MAMDISESEAVESGFEIRLKNYRILEGMGVTFHCKMSGYPLPKVSNEHLSQLHTTVEKQASYNRANSSRFHSHTMVLFIDCMVQRRQAYQTWREIPNGISTRWQSQPAYTCCPSGRWRNLHCVCQQCERKCNLLREAVCGACCTFGSADLHTHTRASEQNQVKLVIIQAVSCLHYFKTSTIPVPSYCSMGRNS